MYSQHFQKGFLFVCCFVTSDSLSVSPFTHHAQCYLNPLGKKMPRQLAYFKPIDSGGVVNWARWYIYMALPITVYLKFLKRRSSMLREKKWPNKKCHTQLLNFLSWKLTWDIFVTSMTLERSMLKG